MRLILVRHGRTASNVGFLLDTAEPGADLDDGGLEQAASLVERLSHHAIEAVYVSNLVRTQQTARPVAEARGLELQVLPELREVPAGDDELSSDATRYIGTLVAWGKGDLEARIPGGENAHEFMARFDAAIATIAASGKDVVMVVSHGAALRVWSMVRVKGFTEALGKAHLDNTGVIVADGSFADGWELAELAGARVFEEPDARADDEELAGSPRPEPEAR
ncbi:MAG TPA: histidine phosphatase family protein [Propionicimonas sp.]|nr:histidine phosphatase family protein [Propionicimonas sp.]